MLIPLAGCCVRDAELPYLGQAFQKRVEGPCGGSAGTHVRFNIDTGEGENGFENVSLFFFLFFLTGVGPGGWSNPCSGGGADAQGFRGSTVHPQTLMESDARDPLVARSHLNPSQFTPRKFCSFFRRTASFKHAGRSA